MSETVQYAEEGSDWVISETYQDSTATAEWVVCKDFFPM